MTITTKIKNIVLFLKWPVIAAIVDFIALAFVTNLEKFSTISVAFIAMQPLIIVIYIENTISHLTHQFNGDTEKQKSHKKIFNRLATTATISAPILFLLADPFLLSNGYTSKKYTDVRGREHSVYTNNEMKESKQQEANIKRLTEYRETAAHIDSAIEKYREKLTFIENSFTGLPILTNDTNNLILKTRPPTLYFTTENKLSEANALESVLNDHSSAATVTIQMKSEQEDRLTLMSRNVPLHLETHNDTRSNLYIIYAQPVTDDEIASLIEKESQMIKLDASIYGISNEEVLFRYTPSLRYNKLLYQYSFKKEDLLGSPASINHPFYQTLRRFTDDTVLYIFSDFSDDSESLQNSVNLLIKKFPSIKSNVEKLNLQHIKFDTEFIEPIKRQSPIVVDIDGILHVEGMQEDSYN